MVAPRWERMAYAFRFEPHEVELISRQNHYRPLGSCEEVFRKWLTQRESCTWRGLIEALRDADFNVLADDLIRELDETLS